MACDVLNRPQQVTYADAVVTYAYDDAGRWTSVGDASGTISWAYDEASRVRTETTNLGVMQYDYNKANQRKTMIAADRAPVNYGYDAAGRLQTIAQSAETFTYGVTGAHIKDASAINFSSAARGMLFGGGMADVLKPLSSQGEKKNCRRIFKMSPQSSHPAFAGKL